MAQPNAINRIFITDNIEITNVDNTLLAFNSGNIIPKGRYSVVDNLVNVTEQIEDKLSVYYFRSKTGYFEYRIVLKTIANTITGQDKNGKNLSGLTIYPPMVFVDGVKLKPDEYTVESDTEITINKMISTVNYSTVLIYSGSDILHLGKVTDSANWDQKNQEFIIPDSTLDRYAFFLNGKLLSRDTMEFHATEGLIHFNTQIKETDYFDYYRFPIDSICLTFDADIGHFGYGPKDIYDNTVPTLYDAIVTFDQHIARLAIDDLRPGFFIRELNTDGCLMIIDDVFENYTVKCLTISPFKKDTVEATDFYVQVPDARSILYYVSEFDLSQRLFPELLGIFQKVLLNETYDSIQRIKNLRSLNKINSKQINDLIEFLGFNQRLTNMELEQKHALLEELNNFYKIVGTRASYNFYNVISKNSKILDIEQLFTPIKDNSQVEEWMPGKFYPAGKSQIVLHDGNFYYCKEEHISLPTWETTEEVQGDDQYWARCATDATERRYVTFYSAEELGAQYKQKYVFPYVDYGKIGQLANPTDILSNEPHGTGTLTDNTRNVYLPCYNSYYPVISPSGEWWVYTALKEQDELEWRANTYYHAGPSTIVVHEGTFYYCVKDHLSEDTWEIDYEEKHYWLETTIKPELRFITPNNFKSGYIVGPNIPTEGYDYGYISNFEYNLDLTTGYTLIEGPDIRGNVLDGLKSTETQVYINGEKLLPDQYTVLSPQLLLIIGAYKKKQVVYIEGRSFIPVNASDTGYENYYYTDALNEENNICYNANGSTAYAIGTFSDYPIRYRQLSSGIEYYIETPLTEIIIGHGERAAILDKYVYTDNIAKPYSQTFRAFNGLVSYRQEYEINDFSITGESDVILRFYTGTATDVTIPNTSKVNVTWYINPEEAYPGITRTNSSVAYYVYDENGNRVYYGEDEEPIIGFRRCNDEGTESDIQFYAMSNGVARYLGAGMRVRTDDIKIDNEVNLNTNVFIWKSDQTPTNIYDYGWVYEQIKGEWIEWFEWDRPAGWYPTNHVNVSLEVPADANYDEFVNEFKKTFYDVASTVLYIHSIINVYNFGYGKNNFGMMSAPTYHTVEVTLTNNAQIQPVI